MPLPHERAAIEAARGDRKEKLIRAAAVLDRVRAEHPGTSDPHGLPPEVRREALDALEAFRARGSRFGVPEIAALLMLAAGLGVLALRPHRVFQCEALEPGLASCRITDRLFGIVTLREETVAGIASADTDSRTHTEQTSGEDGRTRTSTTRTDELVLLDAEQEPLWSVAESRLLGASMADLAADVGELAAGELEGPFARVHASWPVLLAGTVFFTLGASAALSSLGLFLRDRGVVSPAINRVVFYWGPLVAALLLSVAGWATALLGDAPPAWLIAAMGLA